MTLAPDPELVTVNYLRSRSDVTDLCDHVGTVTPRDTSSAWVRVTLIDDAPLRTSRALHLITAYVQVDCYAGDAASGGHEQASRLARTVRDALHTMNEAAHAGAVISGVQFGGIHRTPDGDFQPARERFTFTAEIALHPA